MVKDVIQAEEGILIRLDRHRRRLLPYARCDTLGRVRDRLKERSWKHVPLWGIPDRLLYRPARIRCPACGRIVVEAMPWPDDRQDTAKGQDAPLPLRLRRTTAP